MVAKSETFEQRSRSSCRLKIELIIILCGAGIIFIKLALPQYTLLNFNSNFFKKKHNYYINGILLQNKQSILLVYFFQLLQIYC